MPREEERGDAERCGRKSRARSSGVGTVRVRGKATCGLDEHCRGLRSFLLREAGVVKATESRTDMLVQQVGDRLSEVAKRESG